MRYVFSLLAIVVGIWSLSWQMGLISHVTVLAVCGSVFWITDVMTRPLVPCRYCDKGRSWDVLGTHFGLFCPGLIFGLFSCGGAGRKLRPAIRVLRAFGFAAEIPDPVEAMAED
jgi:hypothetical protein